MKNDYDVRGNKVIIYIPRKDNKTLTTLIDLEDLPIANAHPNRWFAKLDNKNGKYYVMANRVVVDGELIPAKLLHREVTQAPEGLMVDHINHNTLDNRRCNLRVVSNSVNQLNRSGPNKNNKTSGVRGISFDKRDKKYVVQVSLSGKREKLGYFDTLEEAEDTLLSHLKRGGYSE